MSRVLADNLNNYVNHIRVKTLKICVLNIRKFDYPLKLNNFIYYYYLLTISYPLNLKLAHIFYITCFKIFNKYIFFKYLLYETGYSSIKKLYLCTRIIFTTFTHACKNGFNRINRF